MADYKMAAMKSMNTPKMLIEYVVQITATLKII